MSPSNGPSPILLLLPSLVRAGAETQAISLANGLARQGFAVHLATFGENLDQLEEIDRTQVVFHRLQRRGRFGWSLVWELLRLMRTHRFAVIHCTLQISLFYASLARWLSPLRGRPELVVALHTTQNLSAREERFDRWLYRPLIARCARVVFVCRAQATHWIERFPELAPRAAVVYNGVDAERFAPAPAHEAAARALRATLGIEEDAPVLICVARLRREKGHLLLLRALAEQPHRGLHLVLAGDGEMREQIEAQRRSLALSRWVHLLGDVQDTRPLYALADASVLASTSVETFSMAMLESLAMGTPMIATRMGGMGEAIEADRTGWLVPPGDVPALSEALGALAADRPKAARLGATGRDRVCESFTVQAMIRDTAALIEQVAPTTAPAR